MHRLKRAVLVFALGLFGAAAQAAPVTPVGEPYEQLGVALALGERCKTYRPFEYAYLHAAWLEKWYASPANAAQMRRVDAVNVGPNGMAAADKARRAELEAVRSALVGRAAAITCEDGKAYLDLGRIEALKTIGTPMLLAGFMRGQAQVANFMQPLTEEQRGVIGAFSAEVRRLFGADIARFDETVQALARQRMASAGATGAAIGEDFAASDLMREQDEAMLTILFDLQAVRSGYAGNGVWLDDGDPLRRAGAVIGKAGAASVLLVDRPTRILVDNPAANGALLTGAMALMLQKDGSAVIGLFSGDIEKYGGAISVAVQNERSPPVRAEPVSGCPVARCFRIAPTVLAGLPDRTAADGGRLAFFVSATTAPRRSDDVTNEIALKGASLARLLERAAGL